MKTLIAYAGKYGCAKKCAGELLKKLTGEVDLLDLRARKNIDLIQYDKVIIGGSIYMGNIQKAVKEFCIKNLQELEGKKIGLFICCMREGALAERQLNNSFPPELLSKAVAKEYLGGEIDFPKLKFFDRLITSMVAKADQDFPALDENKCCSFKKEDNINRFAELMEKA